MSDLARFLAAHPVTALARVARARGSSPREAGAEMVVSATGAWGTIGGGQVEHQAIRAARDLLENGQTRATLDIALGPESGQCCGGRVAVEIAAMDPPARAAALAREAARVAARPAVLLLGAGHVGRALARCFVLLPVRCALIDSRQAELAQSDAAVETRLTALPEAELAAAPPGFAAICATHEHGLDFLLAAEALRRGDAAYVGMIGSASKRAQFARWCAREAPEVDPARLISPIGAASGRDKRPAVIAACAAAEVMAALEGGG